MTTKNWFERPAQVAFYDVDNETYIGGIAYRDKIICACCGGLVDLDELFEDVAEFAESGTPALISYEDNWEDFSEAIIDNSLNN